MRRGVRNIFNEQGYSHLYVKAVAAGQQLHKGVLHTFGGYLVENTEYNLAHGGIFTKMRPDKSERCASTYAPENIPGDLFDFGIALVRVNDQFTYKVYRIDIQFNKYLCCTGSTVAIAQGRKQLLPGRFAMRIMFADQSDESDDRTLL